MKVSITEDCISCGKCVEICPEVFQMGDQYAEVIAGADLEGNKIAVKEAADECPTSAIIIE